MVHIRDFQPSIPDKSTKRHLNTHCCRAAWQQCFGLDFSILRVKGLWLQSYLLVQRLSWIHIYTQFSAQGLRRTLLFSHCARAQIEQGHWGHQYGDVFPEPKPYALNFRTGSFPVTACSSKAARKTLSYPSHELQSKRCFKNNRQACST